MITPVAIGVAIGWWRQLSGHAVRNAQFISVGFVVLLLLVIDTAGRPYYGAGTLPALTAGAAVQLVDRCRRHRALVSSMIAPNGIVTAPLVLPLLPVSVVVDSPASAVNPEPLEMIGWPEFVDRIAQEYTQIDDGDATANILTGNYGEAGAIDRYGPTHGLPPAYSGHNSYADFRQPPGSTGPILVVGYRAPGEFLSGCHPLGSIVMANYVDNEEQGAPLWRCESRLRAVDPKVSPAALTAADD